LNQLHYLLHLTVALLCSTLRLRHISLWRSSNYPLW